MGSSNDLPYGVSLTSTGNPPDLAGGLAGFPVARSVGTWNDALKTVPSVLGISSLLVTAIP